MRKRIRTWRFNRRLNRILDECGWPTTLRSIFSGDVAVRVQVYDRGVVLLDELHRHSHGLRDQRIKLEYFGDQPKPQ